MYKERFLIILVVFIFAIPIASPSSGKYNLDWDNSNEVLEYHSCGCADSCWVAEVLNKKKRTLKIRLSCDCEKLYVNYKTNENKKLLKNDCNDFNDVEVNGKSRAITAKMHSLLKEI